MYPDFALHESIGFRLSLASRLQERRLEDSLRDLGLTRVTWYVLVALGCEGLRRPSEIAGFTRIDRTATSRALRQLEAAGMIKRTTGTDDRRTTSIRLTDLGGVRLEQSLPVARDNDSALDAQLGAADAQRLRRALLKLSGGAWFGAAQKP